MKKIFLLFILTIVVLTGCQQNIQDDKIEIVTTIYPLAEFAKSVGGNNVKVSMLLPPGADAHNYDPKPSDIIKVNNADFFIYIGEEMEPWANQILNSVEDVIIIEAINYVDNIIEDEHHHDHHDHEHEEHSHEHEEHTHKHHEHEPEHTHEHKEDIIHKIDHIVHEWEDNEISADKAMHEIEHLIHEFLKHDHREHDHHEDEHHHDHEHEHHDHEHNGHSHDHHDHSHEYDPHIWLDFQNNIEIVNAIANYLSDLDKENEEYYQNNALNYNNRLNNLHNEFKNSLENCNKRKIISAGHNIFGYLEYKYDFEAHTIYGLSPDSEPTPSTIKKIIDLIEEKKINYILFEETVNLRLAETIANDANAQTLVFNAAETLTRDNQGKTFIQIMQSNLETLKKAMECN